MKVDLLGLALPAVPVVAGLLGLLVRHRRRGVAAALGTGAAAAALACAVAAALRGAREADTGIVVADFGRLAVTFGTWLDGPAGLVAVAVGVVALCVQVYSVAYLHDDERYAPYAAQVSLFTGAMLLVVVSGDLIALLVGWEVMGICSYLLIGHDRRLPEAPRAAVKAFLVTRVGDVGFLLGIVLLGLHAGSFRIADVFAADLPAGTVTAACVLLLAGVAGKSAQFPLHTWLPDAMAGPTPISALIHAATMVAAGVYVVARLYPLFERSGAALTVLAVMASVTMLLGALAALGQDDIKRVLAWSTVSQLGYMTGALAVGAPAAALFHLLTHAAFKALLFLAAGAVIHAVGTNLMAAMGGLRTRMPVTFWTMTAGLAALAGVPPLAGFWSKDSIIEAAWHATSDADAPVPRAAAVLVLAATALTVLVTAAYVVRLWRRTFLGEPRGAAARAAHEPPWAMRGPLLVLAVPTVLLGFAGLSAAFGRRLGGAHAVAELGAFTVAPLVLLAAGAALAWRRDPAADLPDTASTRLLANAFYLDAVQDALVTRPVTALARLARRTDETVVDGAVDATGAGATGAGALLARAHVAGLPRATGAVLGGAVVIAAVIAVVVGVSW
ncbi:NADH-quinone oxidoreductase subunit L [Dactylosporangium aurantiacum]|uniref:NADH-quinone oxidoreductase subunit L n=1 Tax=Dactylosporangium aurantiacum TaxID=35754 RepID=A0A9Q9IEF0_9ACTN|nr:NADH-quinone oxidoreductase subunit L [Dactylosporangium aurantiacum]MDG6105265.1 NADH-quinone oxidoreductase subunit L [Dactylosporangium aurantiacum]UWZ54181.1 NADH-quinone oxidoreductase subunit L [Dactylosporangium aurantiacum]